MTLLMMLLACGPDATPGAPTETWVIEPYLQPCEGVGPTTCLVAGPEDEAPFWVYDGIADFTFILGDRVTGRVSTTEVADPPEDGSSVRYTLTEELSRTSAVGETFDLSFQPGSALITVDASTSSGLTVTQPWTCAPALCAEIADALAGAAPFDVTFALVDGAAGVEVVAEAVVAR